MLLVDARGVPLSIIVTGANRHDVSQLGVTLDALVVARPAVASRARQHLCADAGFVGVAAEQQMLDRDYTHMCARAAKNARSEPKASDRGVGWSRLRTRGSRAFASCWSDMRRRIVPIWRLTCSLLPSSASAMCP